MVIIKKIASTLSILTIILFSSHIIYFFEYNFDEEKTKIESSNIDAIEDDSKINIHSNGVLTPKGVRLTVNGDLSNSIMITWFTESSASDPNVEYSINSDLSNSEVVGATISTEISGTYIYSTELLNLNSNKTYFYQISSDATNKREIMNITTLTNEDSSHVRFLVYGDSRTNRSAREALSEKIIENFKDKFDFTILLGDIVEDGKNQTKWNNYFLDTEGLNAYKQGIYVEGNHEGGLQTLMYENLPMNNTETNRYYTFSYGGVGFIILNSNSYTVGDDNQTDWLEETLIQLSQENPFNIPYMHHPLLSSRSYSYHRTNWRPLFERYKVPCVFGAHNHHYERSYPIINYDTLYFNGSELYNFTELEYPMYIATGGAGAPLYSLYDYDYIAKNHMAYHFTLIDIKTEGNKTTFSLEAWEMPVNGVEYGDPYLFDNITIIRTGLPKISLPKISTNESQSELILFDGIGGIQEDSTQEDQKIQYWIYILILLSISDIVLVSIISYVLIFRKKKSK